jgi:pimeloyl-ACP methyl ester carboxylesterase
MPLFTTSDGTEIYYKDWAQVGEGNDMDRYADDLAELVEHLDLHDAIHVGHSAGGGEVARYIGRHGESRVAKAVLISAVTPSVLQTDANPAGVPKAGFEALQAQLAANRSEFYRAVPSGPFYNFDQAGVESSEAVITNWWRPGHDGRRQGSVRVHLHVHPRGLHRGTEDLPRVPAWHADHSRRHHQRRPVGFPEVLTGSAALWRAELVPRL